MSAPAARARLGLAVLVTAVGGSLLLSAGTSSSATARPTAAFYGPVAAAPSPRPLLSLHGPLLPHPRLARLVPAADPVGPRATAEPHVGPATVVGPGSPLRQVREVQRRLNAAGAQLRVDGAWGPATTRAVQRLQADAGLPVDGRFGPRTAALLQR